MKKVVIDENTNGKICSVCFRNLRTGEYVVLCEYCGSFTHENCYKEHGCGSDYCKETSNNKINTDIVLTKEEVSNVFVVPEGTVNPTEYLIKELNKEEKHYSLMAIFSCVFSTIVFISTILTCIFSNSTIQNVSFILALLGGGLSIIFVIASFVFFNKDRKLRGIPLTYTALLFSITTLIIGLTNSLIATYKYYNNENNIPQITDITEKKKIAHIIEKASPNIQEQLKSNVCINSGFGLSKSFGSGVVIKNKDQKTYIVTNVHVLTGGHMVSSLEYAKNIVSNLNVTFYNSETKPATILWVAPEGIDLALISCDTPDKFTSSVKIGSSNEIKMGEKVFAIGNPMGLDWTYTEGVVSSFRNQQIGKYEILVIQIQTPLNHGNSGGGLYSEKGNLVGINTWIYEKAKTEGLNFSIAIDELTKTLDSNLLNTIK